MRRRATRLGLVIALFSLTACEVLPMPQISVGEQAGSAGYSSSAALEALDQLPAIPRSELADGYQRAEFGKGWTDVDGNGCNQRDDVLVRDALPDRELIIAAQGSCDHDVLAGTWADPYTA